MTAVSAEAVTQIISSFAHQNERRLIFAADRAAAEMLQSGDSIMLAREDTDHYRTFYAVAESLEGDAVHDATRRLEVIDERLRFHREKLNATTQLGATDAACDRWTPVIDAAYHVGLALGLRLAGVWVPARVGDQSRVTLDEDVTSALAEAILVASPEQKLTLLTLLETPGAVSAAEGLISAVLGGAR
jgi:hypothetical protein